MARLTGAAAAAEARARPARSRGLGDEADASPGSHQQLSGLELELLGEEGLRYSDWTMVRPDHVDFTGRDAGYRYLRAKGNSIEGGTSEILRNIVAERVLGLPAEAPRRQGPPLEGDRPNERTRPALHRDRGRPARQRARPARRPVRPRCRHADVRRRPVAGRRAVEGAGRRHRPGRAAGARGPRRRRGLGARGCGGARGAGPDGRAGAVPHQLRSSPPPCCSTAGTRPLLGTLASGERTAALAVPLSTAPDADAPGSRGWPTAGSPAR